RRWVKLFAFAVLIAGVCVRLGFWQLHRLHDRRAFNAAIEAGMHAPPTPLGELLPRGATPDPDTLAYARVEGAGTYDTAREVLLYGRSLSNDQPGNHVLTPL